MGLIERLTARRACLRGALRTLQDDHADRQESDAGLPAGDRRARRTSTATRRRCSPTASASAIASSPRARTAIARWALAQGIQQGRHGLPDDAEPAGIPGALARHHAGRRRGGAAQHQSDRAALAHCINVVSRSTSSSRPNCSTRCDRARPHRRRRRNLAAWRCRRQFRPHRPRGRCAARRRARRPSAARSPSRTVRSTSTRRARPACPRPPTSTTTA